MRVMIRRIYDGIIFTGVILRSIAVTRVLIFAVTFKTVSSEIPPGVSVDFSQEVFPGVPPSFFYPELVLDPSKNSAFF